MDRIFLTGGLKIFREEDKYLLRIDAGELTMVLRELPISETEANDIMRLEGPDLANYLVQHFAGERLWNARIVPPSEWNF